MIGGVARAAIVVFMTISAPVAAASGVQLVADTPIRLETVTPLSSQESVRGTPVTLRVAEDVGVEGRIVIPKGAVAAGQVSVAERKGAFGSAGRLGIELLYVTAGERTVRLRGTSVRTGGSNQAGAAASSVFLTAVAVAITGKRATIPAGTPLTGYVLRDTMIEAR